MSRIYRVYIVIVLLLGAASASADTMRLQSRWLTVDVDKTTGTWALVDARSGVRWPTAGTRGLRCRASIRSGMYWKIRGKDRLLRYAL